MKEMLFALLSCVLVWNFGSVSGFVGRSRTPFREATALQQSISAGDKVLVVGGTGGVGQLVTKKLRLLDGIQVGVTSRDKRRGVETIADNEVDVFELDLVNTNNNNKAALDAALEGVSALVISVGTTAFPTARWKGGNTPTAIDKDAVTRIAKAAATVETLKKIVLITSVGVERPKEMPFLILNLFGVIDAKKAGEQAVIEAATSNGFDYVIVRPGRLVGGPWTNLDVANLLKIEGGAENGVTIQAGDSLLGDCKRDACAEAVVQCLLDDGCKNVAFSIVSNDEKALSEEQWRKAFQQL